MEILVDGVARQAPEVRGPSLGELLAALRDEVARGGRAITTIALDGRELLPDEEERAVAGPAAASARLEISTAPAAEWGRHGLGEAASAAGQLGDELRAVADLLRAGERESAVARFSDAVAAYGQLIQALVNAAALAGARPPAGFQDCLRAATDALSRVAPALGAEDAVAAADQIEYQLCDRLAALAAMVREMAGQ